MKNTNKNMYTIIEFLVCSPKTIVTLLIFVALQMSCVSNHLSSEPNPSIEPTPNSTATVESNQLNPTLTTASLITTPTPTHMITATTALFVSPTATETTTLESSSVPTPTLEPASMLITDTKNYMLMTSNNILWHPGNSRTTAQIKDMRFSDQPWSPDGFSLATILRTESTPRQNRLAIVSLATGEISILNNL
jgi:hypothetical protein